MRLSLSSTEVDLLKELLDDLASAPVKLDRNIIARRLLTRIVREQQHHLRGDDAA